MLKAKDKKKLIDTVEEEIREMEMYSNLGSSVVEVFNHSGYLVSIKVVADNHIEEEE